VNQALKEVAQRYDFRGSRCTIDFDRKAAAIRLEADDEFRMKALSEVLRTKMVRRHVPVKNLHESDSEVAAGGRVRRTITLQQGIPDEIARRIVKDIKSQNFKKTQVAIQGAELRVTSPSRDTLQEVIAYLREQEYELELQFGNFRS